MPRFARNEIPGVIYHVMARGIDRGRIFDDSRDMDFFLNRLGTLAIDADADIFAFALIPNHVHLLVRGTGTPIATLMQRLLTSHALAYNKRHERSGHLFQNRYRAIPCRGQTNLLALVRYINLNPLRAGSVSNLAELGRFRYASHFSMLARSSPEWLRRDDVLSLFGQDKEKARQRYLEYIGGGDGGAGAFRGPRRQPGSKAAPKDRLEKGLKGFCAPVKKDNRDPRADMLAICRKLCRCYPVTESQILGADRSRIAASARAQLALRMSQETGISMNEIARMLMVSPAAVRKMIDRARENVPEWSKS